MIEQIAADLRRDEGWRPNVYLDSEGFETIGYGFLVDEHRGGGMPRDVGEYWLRRNVERVVGELSRRWSHFSRQPDDVQRALVNMGYQLGVSGLLGFSKMLAALEAGDRGTAAREALDSRWAAQTPQRAQRVAAMIRGE